MVQPALTKPYEPNPLLEALCRRFFVNIRVDEAWVRGLRQETQNASLVYVLRSVNVVDFLALEQTTRRYRLPQLRFVNDLGLWVLNPLGKGWLNALLPGRVPPAAEELRDALAKGGSAALFLKRPPAVFEVASGVSSARATMAGDDIVRALFEVQRGQEKPILVVPLLFVWTRNPDTRGRKAFDFLLGPPEWPTSARALAQVLYHYKRVALHAGEVLNLKEFLAASSGLYDAVLARRATYVMLRRLERERRSVTGPAACDPDRLRTNIIRSPRLRTLIDDLAHGDAHQARALKEQAYSMVKGLQARPEPITLRLLESAVDRIFHRIYAGVEHRDADFQRLREASKDGTLVLLPSHKSHVDYLVLSYVFYAQNLQLPVIAAGENLNFFPIGPIFRRAGAFFIRRSFRGDRLYAAVVDAYVRRLVRDGYPIEVFLEGGRSRTGKLLAPRFGLLSMILDAALALPQKTLSFVPVSIGYERVIEAESYEKELTGGEKTREDATGLLRSSRVLRHRYGRINMQIGQIFTLQDLKQELGLPREGALRPALRRALVTRIGNRAMDEINRVTAVTPGALVALALLTHRGRGIAHDALVERCRHLLGPLLGMRARMSSTLVTPSGALRPDSIAEAMQMLLDAELVDAHEPSPGLPRPRRRPWRTQISESLIYTIPDTRRMALDTTKNILVHFFVERGLVALALNTRERSPLSRASLQEHVHFLSRLLNHEFRFHSSASFETVFESTIATLVSEGVVLLDEGGYIGAGPGDGDWSGEHWLRTYAAILRNFIEGYTIAARSLSVLLRSNSSEKELTKRALTIGRSMYFAGEIEQRESVNKSLLSNAFRSFFELKVLQLRDGTWALSAPYASKEALDAFEFSIACHLREAR